ncbi:hypothetical protein EDC55_10856 [Allofrancisella inopinata]|uniref:Uncharacterized protein n=1 Tax=Allofrancisella inopinata TaxID=1085647 RepID=A0AAE6YH73_9GAMM|nr:hypothetical protein [Allofrancisella inopinata]QIV95705.1 hypothetical protein E4K63_02205 [Allofrancisella inopinata]TDT72163.1 hypothetical protein EDC55_10856 [Allofrancisella inopinata]
MNISNKFKEVFIVIFVFDIFIELFFNRGIVFGIEYSFYFQVLTACLFLYILSFSLRKCEIYYLFFLLSSCVVKYYLTNDTYTLYFYFRLVVSFLLFTLITSYFEKEDLYKTVNILSKLVIYFLIPIIFFEFLSKNLFHSNIFNELLDDLLGYRQSVSNILFERNSIYAIQGLSSEPATLVIGLSCFNIIYILSNKNSPIKSEICFYVCSFISVISGSFSSIILILSSFIILYVNVASISMKKRLKLLFFVLTLCMIIVFHHRIQNLLYFFDLYNNYYTNQNGGDSISIRLGSIKNILDLNILNLLFGVVSLREITPIYSLFFTLLTKIGIIGLILYVQVFLYFCKRIKKEWFSILIFIFPYLVLGDLEIVYGIVGFLVFILLGDYKIRVHNF